MRSSASDEALRLEPVKKLTLEECLEFLNDDELLEVTPENLRIRKIKISFHTNHTHSYLYIVIGFYQLRNCNLCKKYLLSHKETK